MATSVFDLRRWFDRGVEQGATHMLVKTDWFDYGDYPVYVMPGENPRDIDRTDQDRAIECYDLRMDREAQLREIRAFHWGV